MISMECDRCAGVFEVAAADVPPDGRVPCPACGDINRVGPSERGAKAPPAAESRRAGAAGETGVCVVRPAMFRAKPFRYLLIVILAIGGLAGSIFFPATGGLAWLAVPCLVVLVGAIGWFVIWWVASHLWIKVEITDKRTVRYEGIIRRHSTEVLHDHVRSVDIRQTFLQRIFNVGSIGIDSAGQDEIEIEIHDIPGPYEVKRIIDRYRAM